MKKTAKNGPSRLVAARRDGSEQLARTAIQTPSPLYHRTASRQTPVGLFLRWISQAAACARADLDAAEHARANGDLEGYRRLRRRGLRHQMLMVFLEEELR